LTRTAARKLWVCLADIERASPGVSTVEIERRGEKYKRAYPDIKHTAFGLCGHWAKYGAPPPPPPLPNLRWTLNDLRAAVREQTKNATSPLCPKDADRDRWTEFVESARLTHQREPFEAAVLAAFNDRRVALHQLEDDLRNHHEPKKLFDRIGFKVGEPQSG
jgi:hypothetical protein